MFLARLNIFTLSLTPFLCVSSTNIDGRFFESSLLFVGVSMIFILFEGHTKNFFPLAAESAAACRLSNCNVNLHSLEHHLSAVVVNIERRPRVNAYKSFLTSFFDQNFHQLSFSFFIYLFFIYLILSTDKAFRSVNAFRYKLKKTEINLN